MTFSAQMHRMAERKLPFERLVVDASLALQIFQVSYIYTKSKSITYVERIEAVFHCILSQENGYKVSQIPSIAGSSSDGSSVVLYRLGDHVDISAGPMVADTSFLGRRCTVPVAHKISHNEARVYRFQGVALPKELYLNHFAFNILEKRASRLNMYGLQTTKPTKPV